MFLKNDTLLQSGKYRIVRYIASGGFGNTYEAVHTGLNARVAIKEFFPKDFCNRDAETSMVSVGTEGKAALVEKLKKKFIDEARAISSLNHPNIVRVSDVFEENGTAYYVMDYIDGPSLNDIVKQHGALSEQQAIIYMSQIADAVSYIHSRNRLHLDIKPSNIMVDANGNTKLIDFGVSKQYDEESGENTSTLVGTSPGYAPLEQLSHNVGHFSPATDIYSLGATLYKLVTGSNPPEATVLASGDESLAFPSALNNNVLAAIKQAMQSARAKRPQTVDAWVNILCNKVSSQNVKPHVVVGQQQSSSDDEETLVDGSASPEVETAKGVRETDSLKQQNGAWYFCVGLLVILSIMVIVGVVKSYS